MMRPVWLLISLILLVLGGIGLVLPVMPTVPFVVGSAYFAAKGSPKLYNWMLNNPTLGPIIKDWQEHGAIARKTKWITTISLIAAIFLAIALGLSTRDVIIEAVIFAIVLYWVWTRPEPKDFVEKVDESEVR